MKERRAGTDRRIHPDRRDGNERRRMDLGQNSWPEEDELRSGRDRRIAQRRFGSDRRSG